MFAYANNNPIMYTDETGESILGMFLGPVVAVTVKDVVLLVTGVVKADVVNGEVEIINSHMINTPWVQWGYSFYLNHINEETRDIIQGTTSGFQGKWMAHNIAYHVLYKTKVILGFFGVTSEKLEDAINASSPANIGRTVFDNRGGLIMTGLIAFNSIIAPISTIIDFLVYKGVIR